MSYGRSHRIAVVDDDPVVLAVQAEALEREGHDVRTAGSVSEAVDVVRQFQPDLLLLDFSLEDGTAADVLRSIREFNQTTQVLLVTGGTGHPPRQLLSELDIQGYHDKSDGTERLMVQIDASLKHFRALKKIQTQQEHLRHILTVTPEITRLRTIPELLGVALENVGSLLFGGGGLIATENNGLFVFDEPSEGISIHAATGRFKGTRSISTLSGDVLQVVRESLLENEPAMHGGFVTIPLRSRFGDRGCMLIQDATLAPESVYPCQLYANQVVQALENSILYERATIDPLTRIYNRGFGEQRLQEVLRLANRSAQTTSVLMIDVDHFKRLNDTHGHAAGDVALRRIAGEIRETCRTTDVLMRYGGEEFVMVLPATGSDGARFVAERILERLRRLELQFEGKILRVTASIGIAVTHPSETDAAPVLRRADLTLYAAKAAGRDRVRGAESEAP